MGDLFESEMNERDEIKRLSDVVEEMRRAGIKLRNELSDFVDVAKSDNDNDAIFPETQEAIGDWDELIESSGLAWKEAVLSAPCDATLKFLD